MIFSEFDEFIYINKKERGNATGALYQRGEGENSEQWVIKYTSDFDALLEAFSGQLFSLMAGPDHSPETILIRGIHPEKNIMHWMVGSKIKPNYQGYWSISEKMKFCNNSSGDNSDGKYIEGFEHILLLSALLREADIVGNGDANFGVVFSNQYSIYHAFRIDFDQCLTNTHVKDFSTYHSFFDVLMSLDSGSTEIFPKALFNREKIWQAIELINQTSNEAIEMLFNLYKPLFEEIITSESNEWQKDSKQCKLDGLTQTLNQIKNDKNYLSNCLSHFKNPTQSSNTTLFAQSKHLVLNDSTHFIKIKRFFDLYDRFFLSFYENFSSKWTTNLLTDINAMGKNAPAYQNYKEMKIALLKTLSAPQQKLTFANWYINLAVTDSETKATLENEILTYREKIHEYSMLQQEIQALDDLIEQLVTNNFNNSDNQAFSNTESGVKFG